MRREMAEVLTKDAVNLITYGDSDNPHFILGRHIIKQGQIISSYHPYATKMKIRLENGTVYPMESVERTKVYSTFIPVGEKIPYRIEMDLEGEKFQSFRDPYCFEAQISDLDQYLFGQGTHYEIYKKLGAHPMTIDGVRGVYFAVWAPNAKRVSVVGDFNMWDGRIHPMRRLGQSGIFEIFIPDIEEGELYKYEIKTRTGIISLKADPYANMAELSPRTASVVADMNKYQWKDQQWMEKRKRENRYEKPMAIYEVHLGSWKRKEESGEVLSYRELAKTLVDYVADMGYTHVEFIGILEHHSTASLGYQVTGYYCPTSRYGSLEDFMYLVDCFHRKEIGVIIDWIPSHFAKDEYGLIRFDGTYLYEHPNQSRKEHSIWDTMGFNYERRQVKNFLIGSALFWIVQCHVDALRLDSVSSMLYLDFDAEADQLQRNKYTGRTSAAAIEFLKHLNSIVEQYGEGGYTIAREVTAWDGVTRPLKQGGLGFAYKWNMEWICSFVEYMRAEPWMRKYKHGDRTSRMFSSDLEYFILAFSHEEAAKKENSMFYNRQGEYLEHFANLRVAYGFMFAYPGKKLLFMGQEFAQGRDWDENQALDWNLLENETHKKLQYYMKSLLHFYRSHKAFYELDYDPAGFEWIHKPDMNHSELSFLRKTKSGEENLLFVYNFLPAAKLGFRVGVPQEGLYYLVFDSEEEKYGGEECYQNGKIYSEPIRWDARACSIKMNLPPFSMLVFARKELKSKKERERTNE